MWWRRKNTPTVAELKSLYESEMYQDLLREYAKRTNRELDNSEQDESELLHELTFLRKRYALLEASFEEIISEFAKHKDQFLEFQIAMVSQRKYNNDAIESRLVSKIHKTYLLSCFCVFYIAQTAIQKRLMDIQEYLTPEKVDTNYLKLCERIDRIEKSYSSSTE
jgi:hypothetical protein